MSEFIMGLDLGQANDYTAVAVLERFERKVPVKVEPVMIGRLPVRERDLVSRRQATKIVKHYHLRHLERFALGLPYPDVVARVVGMLATEPLKGAQGVYPIVDATGVGRPVVDLLWQAKVRARAVTITGSEQVAVMGSNRYSVPKRDLVSTLLVLLQSDRLKFAATIPDVPVLLQELQAFKVKISKSGHDSYGNDWREAPHDDMVLAVALAAWWGERMVRFRAL